MPETATCPASDLRKTPKDWDVLDTCFLGLWKEEDLDLLLEAYRVFLPAVEKGFGREER